MGNVETVQAIYQAFGSGDVAAIMEHLRDDIVWDEGVRAMSVPYLQAGRGSDHVAAFFPALASNLEFSVFEPLAFGDAGDTVVVTVRERGRNVVTGADLGEDLVAHVWGFDAAGLVASFRHIGDFAIHEAAASAPRGVAPAAGSHLSVVGDEVVVLKADGGHEIFEVSGPAESGPPPHAHPWSESFYVLQGKVELTTDVPRVCGPGEFATIAPDELHTYRLLTDDARMLTVTSGGRASRFFADVTANVAPGAPTAASMPSLVEVAKRNGLTSPLFP